MHPGHADRGTATVVLRVALLVAGRGGSGDGSSSSASAKTVDASALEKQINQEYSSSGAKVTSAKWPEDVKSEKGATLKCNVKWSNGATGEVKVTQESRTQFSSEVVSGSVQIPGGKVEQQIAEQHRASRFR